MATANIEIKGNPTDFLNALEKSRRKIRETRKDAGDMMKKGGGGMAGMALAAGAGAAIGGALASAVLEAVTRVAKSSE